MSLFATLFLVLFGLTLITRLWLSLRQSQHIQKHRAAVPEAFAEKITLEQHHKAADYSCDKIRFGRLSLGWESLWLLLWLFAGGLEIVDQFWRGLEWSALWTGVAFILSVNLIMALIDLPFTAWSTFVIEQKHGFNRTTLSTWLLDMVKTSALMLALGVPLLAAILWLMDQAGSYWWLYAWLLWSGFTLFMMWAFPTFIAPIFNKFSPLDDEALKSRIDKLLQRCGFKSEGVFVVDGSKRSAHGNAYFTGFGANKRIVFYDTLLESLNEDEIEAVLAHELGHYKRNHIRKLILMSLSMSLGGFALLAWLMNSGWFYGAFGISQPSAYIALMLFMMILPVFTFFISPLSSALSRKHEFEADDFAREQSNWRDLVSALVKMYRENASTLTPDPLHSAFYDSHPPASIRIAHLSRT